MLFSLTLKKKNQKRRGGDSENSAYVYSEDKRSVHSCAFRGGNSVFQHKMLKKSYKIKTSFQKSFNTKSA